MKRKLIPFHFFDFYKSLCDLLTDFSDFDFGVFLAVASFFMDAFFGFVADNANFVALNFRRDNFC